MRLFPRAKLAGIAGALAFAIALIVPTTAMAAPPVRLWIDPGHGGTDPGAVANNTLEKDTNLQISKKVIASAQRQGWDVATTRNDDRFVGLVERPTAAGSWKATDFVSIHSNSAGPRPSGNMTIYRSEGGAKLGASIMSELDPLTPYKDIGNQSDVRGLAVLRASTMPSVIVELLSVSNANEAAALRDPAKQDIMAEAVVRGIAKSHGVPYKAPGAPQPKPAPAPVAPKAAPATTQPVPAKQVQPKQVSTQPFKVTIGAPLDHAKQTGDHATKLGVLEPLGMLWRLLFK